MSFQYHGSHDQGQVRTCHETLVWPGLLGLLLESMQFFLCVCFLTQVVFEEWSRYPFSWFCVVCACHKFISELNLSPQHESAVLKCFWKWPWFPAFIGFCNMAYERSIFTWNISDYLPKRSIYLGDGNAKELFKNPNIFESLNKHKALGTKKSFIYTCLWQNLVKGILTS